PGRGWGTSASSVESRVETRECFTTLPKRRRDSGFTLLEVLLTAILSATLMAGLWSLFGTYLRLFETGQARVERSCLLRALASQFTVDLQSVVPPQGDRAGSSTTMSKDEANFEVRSKPDSQHAGARTPQFMLAGNSRILRLEVLQSAPLLPSADIARQDIRGFNSASLPRATQLRTIVYSFEPPRELSANDREPPPGLLRRELTWEETRGIAQAAGRAGSMSQSAEQSELTEGFAPLTSADLLEADGYDDSATWTPEIVALRFRYSDGHGWHDRWDSREQNALPAAVEIAYRLEPVETTRRAGSNSDRFSAAETGGRNQFGDKGADSGKSANLHDDTLDSLDFDDSDVNDPSREEGHLPVIRQIVSLSSLTKSQHSDASLRDDAFTPASVENSDQREATHP
ncbi:MAG: prepilin-type N-terminal cleavage/methylation domain-containing protein, partial [Planctomycetaceae bacterium]